VLTALTVLQNCV